MLVLRHDQPDQVLGQEPTLEAPAGSTTPRVGSGQPTAALPSGTRFSAFRIRGKNSGVRSWRDGSPLRARDRNLTGPTWGTSPRRARGSGALPESRGTQRGDEHEDQDPSMRRIDQGAGRSTGDLKRMGTTSPRSRHGAVYRFARPNRIDPGRV